MLIPDYPADLVLAVLEAMLDTPAGRGAPVVVSPVQARRAIETVLSRGEPIPLAQRPPGPNDLDPQGKCWWSRVNQGAGVPQWIKATSSDVEGVGLTHWCPYWAISEAV